MSILTGGSLAMLSVDCEKKKEPVDCASMKCKDIAKKDGAGPGDAVAMAQSLMAANLMLQGPT